MINFYTYSEMNQTPNQTPGPQGIQGIPGINGTEGPQGEQGIQGIQGPPGEQGIQGLQGPQGEIGPEGPQGDQGPQGEEGPQGPQGIPGIDGTDGEDGYTPIFGIDYFNGTAGAKGDKGDKGDQGDPGEPGADASLEDVYPVGSVYISTVSTNPNTLFGFGTWAAIATGRTLIGIDAGDTKFDTVEETGGAETSTEVLQHTHPATVTDKGHDHLETKNSATTGAVSGFGVDTSTSTQINSGYYTGTNSTGISVSTSNPDGSVASMSLINPYFVVYIWERTA